METTVEALWYYFDNWINWGTPGAARKALKCKTLALIKMDKAV